MLLFWCALVLIFNTSTASAALPPQQVEEITRELQKPIQVHLKNGSMLLGHSIKVSNGTLQIATSRGSGEIIHSISPDQVKRYEIPGEHYKSMALEQMRTGEIDSAIEVMDLLYQQRLNLMPYLPTAEPHYFALYIDLLKSNNPSRAIALATVLSPYLENPKAIELVEAAVMESYHQLKIYDKASELASEWQTKQNPFNDSVMSEFILSEQALREKRYEDAIDQALQPIVFAGPTTQNRLAECYAVAVASAVGLRDYNYAKILYKEMQERDLLWPSKNETLQPYYMKLRKQLEDI